MGERGVEVGESMEGLGRGVGKGLWKRGYVGGCI